MKPKNPCKFDVRQLQVYLKLVSGLGFMISDFNLTTMKVNEISSEGTQRINAKEEYQYENRIMRWIAEGIGIGFSDVSEGVAGAIIRIMSFLTNLNFAFSKSQPSYYLYAFAFAFLKGHGMYLFITICMLCFFSKGQVEHSHSPLVTPSKEQREIDRQSFDLVRQRLWYNVGMLRFLSKMGRHGCEIPVDLTTKMPSAHDQLSKLTGTTLICICMALLMPSIGSNRESDSLTNMLALSILVVTVVVNICIQLYTGVIILFRVEHIIVLCCMMLLLLALLCATYDINSQKGFTA
ncbi:hypothetical protein Scep_021445 [Stephania cephalantha]|uniref:Uncharacterized protein n=1 Tax=Stephania cephalantha TaxID=152367 RepID=A0AAP0F3G2_9MAGN